jgi:DNA-binding response OmpR family regulator
MGQVIEAEGFATLRLSEAASSLPVIKKNRPDLLVLDTNLEAEDAGWILLAEVRADHDTRELPVIVCTSEPIAVETHPQLLAGPPKTAVFIEPFIPEMLVAKIRTTLGLIEASGRETS